MKHSKKKHEDAPLEEGAIGSENDFAPGGNADAPRGGDSSFDASGGTAAADGSGAATDSSADSGI